MFLMKPLILVDRGSSQEFFEKKILGRFSIIFKKVVLLKTEKTGKVFLKIKDVKTVLPDLASLLQALCTTSNQRKEGETDIGSQVLLMPGSGPLAAATLGAMGRYFLTLLLISSPNNQLP